MRLEDIESQHWSQNGEDGIIEYLTNRIIEPDGWLLEIGCGNGEENNSRNLLQRHAYSGMVVDRKHVRVERYRCIATEEEFAERMTSVVANVTTWKAPELVKRLPKPDIDFFSLDIDGPDYWILHSMLKNGFRPKVMCLEYNPSLGHESVTVAYGRRPRHEDRNLYFGCSLAAWRKSLDYRFVTVCSAGINAFFVDESAVDTSDLGDVEWLEWADCASLANGQSLEKRRRRLKRYELHPV